MAGRTEDLQKKLDKLSGYRDELKGIAGITYEQFRADKGLKYSIERMFLLIRGAYTQNLFTILKLTALGALLLVALAPGGAAAPAPPPASAPPGGSLLGVLGTALVPILFPTAAGSRPTTSPRRSATVALVLLAVRILISHALPAD